MRLTPSRWRDSRRWRGTTVTSSISLRNATSDGVRPGVSGAAMAVVCAWRLCMKLGDSSHDAPKDYVYVHGNHIFSANHARSLLPVIWSLNHVWFNCDRNACTAS